VAARPGWGEMTAVVNGEIQVVEEDLVITRPGPRIVDGLEALALAIHPDAFE
jgi:iron complex transport system substrate-binding protein